MKLKIWVQMISMLSLLVIGFVVVNKTNAKTLDEVIQEHEIEDVFYSTVQKGNTIIFYSSDNEYNLSVGLIEKTFWGYRWGSGFGSSLFDGHDQLVRKAFSNLMPRSYNFEEDLVSLTFGVIHDDDITGLKIGYKNQYYVEATVIDTALGRIWFSFTDTPVNYDPKAIRIYEDGHEIIGWY